MHVLYREVGRGERVSESATKHILASRMAPLDFANVAPALYDGFRALIEEACARGVLDPPHGRTRMPDPHKIVEGGPSGSDEDIGVDEDEGNEGNMDEENDRANCDDEDDDDNLLAYKYDYGFNALVFLGEYLRRNNPRAIQ
ncbi:unnamed protein product, partial [Discosporangium mesarthrocarpum]